MGFIAGWAAGVLIIQVIGFGIAIGTGDGLLEVSIQSALLLPVLGRCMGWW
jgi:hypothetical protein